MENAKIDKFQLFVLIYLFELGSTLLIPLGIDAKNDAWLAILLGMVGGFLLLSLYFALYQYHPDLQLTEYSIKILGKYVGWVVGFAYSVYFLYIAARVLRDFGDMLVTFAYPETPLFIINFMLIATIMYVIHKGIEVLARTGEILFVLMCLLGVLGFILICITGLIDFNNLKPVLEEGIKPVLNVVFTETLYVPFGETIAFTMIFPYVNNHKNMKLTGYAAMAGSGMVLVLTMAINIAVLGYGVTYRSQFPLLTTIQQIKIGEFLARLDIFFIIALMIGAFFKISIFYYGALFGFAALFNVKKISKLILPLGFIALLCSAAMARSAQEHIKIGLEYVPMFLHIPFQIIIPVLLMMTAFARKKFRK